MKTIKLVLACLMVMQLLILWIFSMNIMFTNQEDEPINIVGQTIKISDQKWLVECWGGDPGGTKPIYNTGIIPYECSTRTMNWVLSLVIATLGAFWLAELLKDKKKS